MGKTMKLGRLTLALVLTGPLASCATDPAPSPEAVAAYDYGPAPTSDAFWALTESTIRLSLIDPDSAVFYREDEIKRGYFTQFMGPTHWGYYSCGSVNAKNQFGGYAGRKAFVSVWSRGEIVYHDVDTGDFNVVNLACVRAGF